MPNLGNMWLSFLGLLAFLALSRPSVYIRFRLLLHGTVADDEIMGMATGHTWYIFSDVYLLLHNDSRALDFHMAPPIL